MNIKQFFQNKKIIYAEVAAAAIILLVAAVYFLDLFGWGEKMETLIRNGKVIEEKVVIPRTEKVNVVDGRMVGRGTYDTPLVPKSDEERIIVPSAVLTLKGSYDIGKREAEKWSADAKPVFIKSLGAVTLDGKSGAWQVVFGSKTKKAGYEIIVQADEVVSRKEIPSDSFGYDLPNNWHDSVEAIKSLQSLPQFSKATASGIGFYYNTDGKNWGYVLSTSNGTVSMPVK